MKRTLLLSVACLFLLCASLSAALSRQVVNYDIRARLTPDTKMVDGSEVLTWLNDSDTEVSVLRFHLYLNAFKNNRSTFMKERGGPGPSRREEWGRIDVTRIAVLDGTDLTATMTFVQPDDDNADDRTVMQVSLPAPVKPGERITLAIDFKSKLPIVMARSGYVGDFFMVGQWFPKIGVLQNGGTWNCHQYHGSSEFFADYGAFKVAITVPAKFVVGATGKRVSETANPDGTRTYVHVQEDVHDFAWTACPDFVEVHEKYSLSEPPVETEMILLVHRSHKAQVGRYARALKNGLEFYSKSYGPYPYPTITLVDPAPGAMAAGGMEYPTLFTADTTSYMPGGVHMPEMVTIHEFGHGYWYGIVGSNEFEEAWLDEGLNSYSEAKAMDKYYGADRSMIDLPWLRIGEIPYQRMSVIGAGRFDPIVKFSWNYVNSGSYSMNVYQKASLMLQTLERILGEDVMSRVMKTYYERWRFRHPTTADFVATVREVSGRDLSWYFDQVLRSADKLDYGISDLKASKVRDAAGLFDQTVNEGTAGVEAQKQTVHPPAGAAAAAKKGTGPAQYRNTVLAYRFGEWIFPQEIEIVFSDGSKVRETWDGRDRWKRFIYVKPVKVASAEVDPDHKYLLDSNLRNNGMVLEPAKGPVIKYAAGSTAWFQVLLSLSLI